MNFLLVALIVALATGLVTWGVAIARRRGAQTRAAREHAVQAAQQAAGPSAANPVAAAAASAAEIEAARATARAKADRVIAAEAARRRAAVQKAQNVARVEAERRVANAAKAATGLHSTMPLRPLPRDGVALPMAKAPLAAPAAMPHATPPADVPPRALEKTVPLTRPVAVAVRPPAAPAVRKTAAQTLIMLVDDSKMVRVKSGRLLAAHEFQVVTAIDGVDALKQLQTCCPDLVITDVDMPEMDGFGLTSALRSNPRTRHIPIVMITSAEERHRQDALRAGVGLVMGKPYDEAALIAHIHSFEFVIRNEESESLACA